MEHCPLQQKVRCPPRARDIKKRISKWHFIQIKSFCMAKEKSSKMKREPTVWENIFTNDISDKGLISKIYKELTQLHPKKTNNPTKKWAKDLQGGHKEGPETYYRMLSITSHHRDQIKDTMRYHFTVVRMAIINKSTNKCW